MLQSAEYLPGRRSKEVRRRPVASVLRWRPRLAAMLMLMITSLAVDSTAVASETGPGLIADLQIDGNYALFAVSGPVVNHTPRAGPAGLSSISAGDRQTDPGLWHRHLLDLQRP